MESREGKRERGEGEKNGEVRRRKERRRGRRKGRRRGGGISGGKKKEWEKSVNKWVRMRTFKGGILRSSKS